MYTTAEYNGTLSETVNYVLNATTAAYHNYSTKEVIVSFHSRHVLTIGNQTLFISAVYNQSENTESSLRE
jgi:hypothetical protein